MFYCFVDPFKQVVLCSAAGMDLSLRFVQLFREATKETAATLDVICVEWNKLLQYKSGALG